MWTEGDLEVASNEDEWKMLKCAIFEEGAGRQIAKAQLDPAAFRVHFHAIIYQGICELMEKDDLPRVMAAPLRDIVEDRCRGFEWQGTSFEDEWKALTFVQDLSLAGATVYLNRIKKRFARRLHRLRMIDLRDVLQEADDDGIVSEPVKAQTKLVVAQDAVFLDHERYIITPEDQRELASQFGYVNMDTVTTGFPIWDQLVAPAHGQSGLLMGANHIISGSTGHGKSTLARTLFKNLVCSGVPSAYLNWEMTKEEMVHDIASAFTGYSPYSYRAFMEGTSDPRQKDLEWKNIWSQWSDNYERMTNENRMAILNKPTRIWEEVKELLASLAACGYKVVFLDTINRLTPGGNQQARHELFAEICRDLDQITPQLGITLIATAQENREKRLRPGKRPVIWDIAESIVLSQVSNSITQIYRGDLLEGKDFVEGVVTKSRGVGANAVGDDYFPMRWSKDSGIYVPMEMSTSHV
jgi:hypothetical protein